MANPSTYNFRYKQTATRREFMCEKCGEKILKGTQYWRASGGGFRYHPKCVGFIWSRYSFVDTSRLGAEEAEWKKRWDNEIQAKIGDFLPAKEAL